MRKYFLMQAAPVQHIIGWVLKCADVVIALSRQWQLFLLNEVRSDLNVVVIENTIDSDFAAENEKDDYPKRQDGNTVLFVGQLARAKGVFDILSAAQVVLENRPGTRFLIAGGSQEAGILDELQQRTDEAGLSGAVHLLGLVTGTAKVNLFRQATVFILPSYGEGMPYVLLEAMSVGLPIITTPVGSIPEIIRNEINGFLVEPGDVQAIALRLIQLLKDPLLRNQFGQVNRMLIRDSYLPDSAMNRLVGIYDQLM